MRAERDELQARVDGLAVERDALRSLVEEFRADAEAEKARADALRQASDKDRALAEAFRVLKPGGRLAVSDVVVDGDLPEPVRQDMESYVGCVAGALERSDYLAKLARAGFSDAAIEPTRRYTFADLEASCCGAASCRPWAFRCNV